MKARFAIGFFLVSFANSLLFCSKPPKSNMLLRIDGPQHESQLGRQVRQFADIDGDSIPEIIASSPTPLPLTSIAVYSGASGAEIYRISSELNKCIVMFFAIIADLNKDGIPEIAAADEGSSPGVVVFSGKDGALLLETERLYLKQFAPPKVISLPDRNGDGVPEFALDQPRRNLLIFSGSDGAKLEELAPPAEGEEMVWHDAAPDADGDGFPDILGLLSVKYAPYACFYSSKDFSVVSGPFPLPIQMRPERYEFTDLNADAFPDLILVHHTGGKPEGSLLVALSGKDGSELWRVNGTDVEGGKQMIVVDADTSKTLSTYPDIDFADSLAILPDMNGDNIPEVATGHANFFDKERKIGGCVLVFSGRDGQLLKSVLSPDRNCRIGASIAPFTDIDFDGAPDLLLGSPTATAANQTEAGCILVMGL